MKEKEYKFLVSMCGGWCNGTLSFYAEDEDEAYGKAMDYVGEKLTTAFPKLDILYNVELYESKNKMLFESIKDLLKDGEDCSNDFFVIYEDAKGEKWISFEGYIYTNGEPGTDENGEFDESLTFRVVDYSSGMEFLLKEYLEKENLYEEAYDIRGNDYIGDVTEEEALAIANNWFGTQEVKKISEITMDTPCGYYVKE